jgi:geranylgeranyl diphosphate synthase, type I
MTAGAAVPPSWGSPLDAEDLRARVHKALDDFLARQADALERVSPTVAPLGEAIADLVRGGKRLRPAFCYWGWRGAGGPDSEAIVHAAAAMELFQAAALIHDDVMDGSDTRRGMPSVHRRFASRHAAAGWAGDGERFGLAGAVLAGDLCLVWSGELLAASGLGPQRLVAARAPFDRMRTELMAGQYLDMLEQAVAGDQPETAVDRARRVIRYKSAKYTIEEPLLIGGTLAGADPALLATYSAYGLTLGEAFQLRDDVLGVFGDPWQTGKPAGDDLREGKRTVLVAETLRAADAAQRARVQQLLGRPDLDATGVDTLRGIIRETGALDAVERLITELVTQARAALHAGNIAPPAVDVLDALIDAATDRTA